LKRKLCTAKIFFHYLDIHNTSLLEGFGERYVIKDRVPGKEGFKGYGEDSLETEIDFLK